MAQSTDTPVSVVLVDDSRELRQLVRRRLERTGQFDVVAEDGRTQHWTAETTSPSILRRRGWSQQSFEPGEQVKLEGMPSIDGSYLMRITRAFRADGTEIGVPPGTNN